MRSKRRASSFIAVMMMTGLLGLGLNEARAQSGGYTNYGGAAPTWNGYAPNTGWSGYAATAAPAPVAAPAAPSTAWNGYAPATGWRTYNPGASWRGYTPGAVVPRATVPRQSTTSAPTRFRPAHYREYGSGRNVFMHKPWLPNHP